MKKYQLILKQMKEKRVLYLMMAPFLVLFFLFTILPVITSIYYSFTNFNILEAPKFVGFANYINLILYDEIFMIAIRNTIILALFTGPISYMLAFVIAWLINELPRKIKWFLTLIFYAPSISGSAFLLWSLIFSSDMYGYANSYLMKWGIINEPILWLQNPDYVLGVVIIVQLWLSLGVSFLAFIAGLQNVDKTLFEAGAIDGVKNRWQELWYITLPQMKPQLMFGAVMQISASFGVAAVPMALAGMPSVEYSAHTIALHLLDFGSTKMEMGYASAIATILFLLMVSANLLVQKILRRVGT